MSPHFDPWIPTDNGDGLAPKQQHRVRFQTGVDMPELTFHRNA
jgi:hypothetical protein